MYELINMNRIKNKLRNRNKVKNKLINRNKIKNKLINKKRIKKSPKKVCNNQTEKYAEPENFFIFFYFSPPFLVVNQ